MSDRETNLLASVTEISWRFYLSLGVLSAVVCFGLYAYIHQIRQGLVVTGMGDEIAWGLYITNFVFFIDISKGGTLISATLRLSQAGWRRPITRLAEAMSVFALCIAVPMVMLDLGRPDRVMSLFRYGRIQSTIVWDIVGVTTYLVASVVYLYLPLIPDLATLASQPGISRWRQRLYKKLSVGWTGSSEQWQLLKRGIRTMAIVVILLAISVHTSWIFAMTLRPGWNSSIFGPYFIIAALYSGCAVVIVSMYVFRKIFRLEDYLEQVHFRGIGALLLVFSVFFLYFNINEYLTMSYKFAGSEKTLLDRLFSGDYAVYFWTTALLAKPLPLLLLVSVLFVRRWQQHIIPGTVLASLSIVIALWLEHFVVIVPTMATPLLPMQGIPVEWMRYRPTWVEWAITSASFAAFLLIFSLLSKLFPLVSIWENREVGETEAAQKERAVPVLRPQPHMPSWVGVLIIACVLGAALAAKADEPHPGNPRQAITLSLQCQKLPAVSPQPAEPEATKSQRVVHNPIYLVAKRFFGFLTFSPANRSSADGGEKPFPPMALNVALRDEEGKPLSFQVVRFTLQTTFGSELEFGSRPTNEEGRIQLVINDRRCGKFFVKAAYAGNDANQPASAESTADFGPCPSPMLPTAGILITPYATPGITIPFLGFYGLNWIAVIYSLGYLALWRIPRASKGSGLLYGPGTGPGGGEMPSAPGA